MLVPREMLREQSENYYAASFAHFRGEVDLVVGCIIMYWTLYIRYYTGLTNTTTSVFLGARTLSREIHLCPAIDVFVSQYI